VLARYSFFSSFQYIFFNAGAKTTPKVGINSEFILSTKATLTVNSPFLFINSFVPSSGSINQNFFQLFRISNEISLPSSDNIGYSLNSESLLKIMLI
jgi:hypothetical protein